MKMHPIHSVWCSSKEEAAQIAKVQSFLDHLDLQEKEDGSGGITWLELFILYNIHGGSKDEMEAVRAERLSRRPMLQKQIAEFKKVVRKINTYSISEGHTWHLETSYV